MNVFEIFLCFTLFSWAIGGLVFAYSQFERAKYWAECAKTEIAERGEDEDEADWWKTEQPK